MGRSSALRRRYDAGLPSLRAATAREAVRERIDRGRAPLTAQTGLIGADVLARALVAEGADRVFGVPGTQNVPTFQAFRRARLRTVLCVHELGAAFMANGFARASGRVGVIATIPGPGFTYALPGLAEARLDSAPLLHVVGQPPAGSGGRFLHQAIPQESMVEDLVKAVVAVDEPGQMRDAVRRAWRTALDGDPGPVVLHVSPSAQSAPASKGEGAREEPTEGGPTGASPDLESLVTRVGAARRPLIYVGQGAAAGATHVRALVDRLGAPVFSTPSGRGVVDERHPRCLRFDPDRSSVAALNELIAEADLILALGCRMGYNGTAAFGVRLPADKLVHVNTDREALEGLRPAGLAIHAAVEVVVPILLDRIGPEAHVRWTDAEVDGWRERIVALEGRTPAEPRLVGVPGETPRHFIGALRSALPDDGIVVTDSGLHQVMVRRHLTVTAPRGLIVPADFQSMGFGVPAAIGAAMAAPDRPVVAVVGDGGMAMAAMELLTAARERVGVVVVVVNDGHLNLIRLQQIGDDGVTHAVDLRNPDFRLLAEAVGVGYALVDGEPEATLRWALDQRRPVLVELLAGDSPEISRARLAGGARRVARAALGPSLRARLKRLLGSR